MCEPVASGACTGEPARPHSVQRGLVIGNLEPELVAGGMALHAIAIHFPRLTQVNGALGLLEGNAAIVGEIHPNVAHASGLGDDRAEHSVVGMTRVAILAAKKGVTGVARSERQARWIVRVFFVQRHEVA